MLYPTNYSQKPLLKAVSSGIGQVAADIEGKIIIIDLSTYNLLLTITVTWNMIKVRWLDGVHA